MRVFPFFTVGANISRSVPPEAQPGGAGWPDVTQNGGMNCGTKTCSQAVAAAPAGRRQRPASNAEAYTMFGLSGSSPRSVMPNDVALLPFQTIVNVLPPSSDS